MFKEAVSTRSADGPSALPSALGEFQSSYLRKLVPMRMRPPAVRVSHPHWTRKELKTARFGSFSIFGALWTRFDCLKYQCLPGKLSKQSIHYSINPWFKASKLGLSFGYIMRGYYSRKHSIHYLILSLSTHSYLAEIFWAIRKAKESSQARRRRVS